MNDLYTIVGVTTGGEHDMYSLDRKLEYSEVHYIGDQGGLKIARVKDTTIYVYRGCRIKPLIGDQIQLRPLTRQESEGKALRYNEGKLQWHLLHIPFIEGIIKVLEFGKEKYSEDNWKKPMDRNTILDSQMRHQAALMKGEEIDPESGLPHAYHLACNTMFYSYHSQ